MGRQRLPAGHHQRRSDQRAVLAVHRQAVELCGTEGHQQKAVAADAQLLAAHDPGADQLLDHQRLRPVLCARNVRRAGRAHRQRMERPAFHRLLPAYHPDHAGSDLLRCVAAFRRHRGGGARPVLYQDLPHLFQRAVLLCGGYYLAVPPGDARHEVQLLLRMALCAVPRAGFHLQLLQPVHEQRVRCDQKVAAQHGHHDGGCHQQLHHELLLYQVVGACGRDLCVLPWPCAGVHPACGGRPPHDRDARPPGAGAGKCRRTGV